MRTYIRAEARTLQRPEFFCNMYGGERRTSGASGLSRGNFRERERRTADPSVGAEDCLEVKSTADPSAPLRSGRDDKGKGGYSPEHLLAGWVDTGSQAGSAYPSEKTYFRG
jgi:hypothetical protein